MHEFWVWCASNPEVVAMACGAIVSLLYKLLDDTTKGHAFLSLLAATMPFDLPKMASALGKLVQAFAKKKSEIPVVLAFVLTGVAVSACKDSLPEVAKDVTQIEACQAEGRAVRASDAGNDAAWAAYDSCMSRNGYRDGGVDAAR